MSLFTQFSNALLGKPQNSSNFSTAEVVPAQQQLVQAQQTLAKQQARQQQQFDVLTQFVGEHAADYVQHKETVNTRLSAAEQRQLEYEQRIQQQEQQLQQYGQAIAGHDDAIAKLQQKHEGVAKQVTANHARLDQHDKDLDGLVSLCSAQQKRIEELEAGQKKLETANSRQAKQLTKVTAEQKAQAKRMDSIEALLKRAKK